MNDAMIQQFATGFGGALAIGAIIRILVGMRLNLSLISEDSRIPDQAVIPITSVIRNRALWKTLVRRHWREDIHITLMDYQGQTFTYRIGYGLWRRYFLVLTESSGGRTSLDHKELAPGKRYSLRTGMKLRLGDRGFAVLVSLERPSTLGVAAQ